MSFKCRSGLKLHPDSCKLSLNEAQGGCPPAQNVKAPGTRLVAAYSFYQNSVHFTSLSITFVGETYEDETWSQNVSSTRDFKNGEIL